MRRICTQVFVGVSLAGMTIVPGQAGDVLKKPLEVQIIETQGLPPVTVFIGDALDARREAGRHEAALAEQRAAARTAKALAALSATLPDYPAQAPLIVAVPVLPVPDYPAALAGLETRPGGSADISSALKTILAGPDLPSHPRLTRSLREEIVAFYAARDFRPLWSDGHGLTARGEDLLKTLLSAGNDGLDALAYAVDRPVGDAAARVATEFKLSQSAVLYARDAQGGRIDAKRLSNLIDPEVELSPAADVLSRLADSGRPGQELANYNPPHPGYRALRAQLAQLRAASASLPVAPAATVSDSQDESRAVAAPAKRRKTVVLATAATAGEADIIANMERWRWLPRELGDRHVFVNIPEYRVRVIERGVVAHEARAIVGKPDSQTPIFSDQMQFLVVNPSWFVPPSIMKKEFLPKLAQDPTYAERRGYQVIRRGSQIYVKQPPGERNALGHIKFMFPNRHAVYLHDTPSRGLFGAERRAFSHGCVRVDQPFRLAEKVLGPDSGWTEQRVRGLVGRGEQSVKLGEPLPVHLTYFTTFVNDLGRLETRDDIYGHNRRVKGALGLL